MDKGTQGGVLGTGIFAGPGGKAAMPGGTPRPNRIALSNSLELRVCVSVIENGPLAGIAESRSFDSRSRGGNRRKSSEAPWKWMSPSRTGFGLPKARGAWKVTTEFDNRAKDHWSAPDVSHGFGNRGVLTRTAILTWWSVRLRLPNCDGWKEEAVGTYPFRTFCRRFGWQEGPAIFTEGLPEFAVFDD
jgi:hypothetical protein